MQRKVLAFVTATSANPSTSGISLSGCFKRPGSQMLAAILLTPDVDTSCVSLLPTNEPQVPFVHSKGGLV